MNKTFKSLDEQITILRSKGLNIPDVEDAKEILLRENYFFLSGYRLLFMQSESNRKFIEGTTFDEIYAMFQFDRHVRNIVFKNLLIIENNIKSISSYQLSSEYGIREEDYLNPKNFTNDKSRKKQVADILRKMQRQIRINGSQHEATAHYIYKYGYVPLWIAVKVLSFGVMSELFLILKPQDQIEIAKKFKIDSKDLSIYLPILANFRNLCAHEDVLFNHKTQRNITNTRFHAMLKIPTNEENEYIKGRNDLFAIIIIFKQLLRKEDFFLLMSELEYEIQVLSDRLRVISVEKVLDAMGFPINYEEMVKL